MLLSREALLFYITARLIPAPPILASLSSVFLYAFHTYHFREQKLSDTSMPMTSVILVYSFVSESNPTKEPLAFQRLPPWSQHWSRMSVVWFRFILKSAHCVSIGFMIRIKSFHMVTAVSLYDFHNTKLLFLLWNKSWCDGLNYLIKWDDVKKKKL